MLQIDTWTERSADCPHPTQAGCLPSADFQNGQPAQHELTPFMQFTREGVKCPVEVGKDSAIFSYACASNSADANPICWPVFILITRSPWSYMSWLSP